MNVKKKRSLTKHEKKNKNINLKKASSSAIIEKKYVLIKGRDGLGNRILSALTGILYAKITDRNYYIDWSDNTYSQNGINAFHYFFDCPFFDINYKLPVTDSIFPYVWINNLNKSSIELTTEIGCHRSWVSSAHLDYLDYPQKILVLWMCIPEIYLLRKYFYKYAPEYYRKPDIYIFCDLFKKNFILKKEIQEKVDKFKKQYFKNYRVIGVHIRYTDKVLKLDKILKKIRKIKKQDNKAKIFLATDSMDIIDIFKKNFGEIFLTEKWFPDKGEILHQNRNCPDRIKNGIEALIDMYLLADCSYLVYGHCSTFGYIANILSEISEENKFDINRKKFKEYIPKIIRRRIWEFFENVKGVPIAKLKK